MKSFHAIIGGITSLAIVLGTIQFAFTYPNGSPGGRTGAIGEATCNGSGCHNNTVQSGATGSVTNTLTFNGATATSYTPGATYTLNLATTGGTARHGFELMALNSSNAQAGTFTAGAGNTTIVSGGKTRMTQTGIYSGSISFRWVAPATDVGPITFYAITYSGSGRNSMSSILRTSSWTLTPATTSVADLSLSKNLLCFPNPAKSSISLATSKLSSQTLALTFTDVLGKTVKTINYSTLEQPTIDIADLSSGLYTISGVAKEGNFSLQFVKE